MSVSYRALIATTLLSWHVSLLPNLEPDLLLCTLDDWTVLMWLIFTLRCVTPTGARFTRVWD